MYYRFAILFSTLSAFGGSTRDLGYEMAWLTCSFADDGGQKLLSWDHQLKCIIVHCHSHLALFQNTSVTYGKRVIPK
jgi:hypothetical protein